jgi:hypothetical protein
MRHHPLLMPFMSPPWGERPQSSPGPIPPRVEKALQFLSMCNQKTMSQAAVSDNQIQEIEGQKLTEEEQVAQATACNLLNQDFTGSLQPDIWEKKDKKRKLEPMKVLMCPGCAGASEPKENCPLCEGSGTIVVVAGGDKQNDE